MGEWVGSDWTVLSGLNAGDRVIVDNLLKVRPGAAVTPQAPVAAAPGGPAAPAPAAEQGRAAGEIADRHVEILHRTADLLRASSRSCSCWRD